MEIIPLIDVVFFLLATFVLFTLAMERLGVFEVPLPQGQTVLNDDPILFIQAREHGAYEVRVGRDGSSEVLARDQLSTRLAEYASSTPRPRVMVQSDERATFGAGVLVLEEVRKARIQQVSIETVRAREPAGTN